MDTPVPAVISEKIWLIRGKKVMLDKELAILYKVEIKRLMESVKRHNSRFPDDFMFQLNTQEYENLRSHIATSSWGGRRYLPYVFTEQGVAMLSSILHSERAIQVNIAIMRAFVKLKEMISSHEELAKRLDSLEKKLISHDTDIRTVFEAIRELMSVPDKPKKQIGFHAT